jgi:ATP-dependent protease Clp ATPase subunit
MIFVMSKTNNISDAVKDIVDKASTLKPSKLYMSDLKWKYLVRSALRGKNILIIGPSGQGKTLACRCLAEALKEEVTEEVTEEQLNLLKNDPNVHIIKTESSREDGV